MYQRLKALSAALRGRGRGPARERGEGEVVDVAEAMCEKTEITHLTQPLPRQERAERGMSMNRDV